MGSCRAALGAEMRVVAHVEGEVDKFHFLMTQQILAQTHHLHIHFPAACRYTVR